MTTICFYQDSRHDKTLEWIRSLFDIGYLSKRNDGMSELRINGYEQTERILELLLPYIKFKQVQAKALIKACKILNKGVGVLNKKELKLLVDLIIVIQRENYGNKAKKTKADFYSILGLTP